MKKNVIRLNEEQLNQIIAESIKGVLKKSQSSLNEEWNGLLSTSMSADEVITEVIKLTEQYIQKAHTPEAKKLLEELNEEFVNLWAVY